MNLNCSSKRVCSGEFFILKPVSLVRETKGRLLELMSHSLKHSHQPPPQEERICDAVPKGQEQRSRGWNWGQTVRPRNWSKAQQYEPCGLPSMVLQRVGHNWACMHALKLCERGGAWPWGSTCDQGPAARHFLGASEKCRISSSAPRAPLPAPPHTHTHTGWQISIWTESPGEILVHTDLWEALTPEKQL